MHKNLIFTVLVDVLALRGQVIESHRAGHFPESCFVSVSVFSCFMHMNVIFLVPVHVLAPLVGSTMVAGPSTDTMLITQLDIVLSWLQYPYYTWKHCGLCFMHINVNFTVPLDVLAPCLPGHLQTLCWCYNINTYSDKHCSSCIRMWLWLSCLQSCEAFHRHSGDHSIEYFFIKVPVATCTVINFVFLFDAYECDLYCACGCPVAMVARPSADTVLITQLYSFQYLHVLWKT